MIEVDFDATQVGKQFQNIRKQKGLFMKELVDHDLSSSTMSRIEKGHPCISLKKYKLYAQKLGVTLDRVMKQNPHDKEQELLRWKLISIESRLESEKYNTALDELNTLKIQPDHAYVPLVHYLKARCLYLRGVNYMNACDLKKAKKEFYFAIQLSNKNPENNVMGILSVSYNYLSAVYFYEGDFSNALLSVEQGIDNFNEETERNYIRGPLIVNQALYLVNLKRFGEAKKILEQIDIASIDIAATKTVVFELLARVHRYYKCYAEAREFALKGLEIGQRNHLYHQIFELWNILGGIHAETAEHDLAEECFRTALDFRDKILNDHITASTFIEVGQLYLQQKKWDNAKKAIILGVELLKPINGFRYIDALIALGDFYQAQKQYQEAAPPYEEALNLSKRQQLLQKQRDISVKLCEVQKHLNQDKFQYYLELLFTTQKNLQNESGVLKC